jgi:hypothetical protein
MTFFKRFGLRQNGPLKYKLLQKTAQENIKVMCMQGAAMRERITHLRTHLFHDGVADDADKSVPYGSLLNEHFNLVAEFDILMGVLDGYAHDEAKKAIAKYCATDAAFIEEEQAPPVQAEVPQLEPTTLKFGQGKHAKRAK